MAFYRSAFNPADDRAKNIQTYIASFNNPLLSDRDMYIHALDGSALLADVLGGTDYHSRLNSLGLRVKALEARGEYVSRRVIARRIIALQQEYINAAGINGRPGIKAVEMREDKKDKEILATLGGENKDDQEEDSVEL